MNGDAKQTNGPIEIIRKLFLGEEGLIELIEERIDKIMLSQYNFCSLP